MTEPSDKDREEAKDTAREILLKYKVDINFDVAGAAKIIELHDSRIRAEAFEAGRAEERKRAAEIARNEILEYDDDLIALSNVISDAVLYDDKAER